MLIKKPAFYDVSHWKDIPDFTKVDPKPLLFGTKATEGTTLVDSKFVTFFAGMKQIGVRRLAYHFHRKIANPTEQARHFCNTVRPHITKEDILALDVEEGGETAAQLQTWLEYVMAQFPENMVWVYSRKNLLDPIPMFIRSLFPGLEGKLVKEHPLNAVQMSTAQRAFFTRIPVWTAGYPANPDLYDSVPSFYVPDPAKWGPVWAWQYTDKGKVVGIVGDVDLNWMSPALIAWLGGQPSETEDAISYPFPGVKRIVGRRNGSTFYLNVIDPRKTTFTVAHASGSLRRPSDVAKQAGASMAWNGDDWNKAGAFPFKPLRLAVSDGIVYVWRYEYNPSLGFREDGTAAIYHEGISGFNVTSGYRYIVQNGFPSAYLDGNEVQYTEMHPRSAKGMDANGNVMIVTVDGRQANERGMTLKELALLLIEFGCKTAFDSDSGGSSVDVMKGIVQNKPSDGSERSVVQFIFMFAEGDTMANGTAKEKLGNIAKRRASPSRYGSELGQVPAYGVIEYLEIVPALPQGIADKAGELWFKLVDNSFVNYKLQNANGVLVEYFTILSAPTPEPPPPDPEPIPTDALLDIVVTDPSTGKRYGGNGIKLPELP